ncbi:MAG: ribosome maturation factor RimP [Oscillospiraceae bacterium]|nr:ribosome maturation factor RimP [Oscillospiraceae bacterium]
MAVKKIPVAERTAAIAAPIAEQLGLSVWDVFYGKEGQDMILRITIDKPGGIGIADCEALSRAVDPLLDEAELTNAPYRFEVSSPGLGRRIRTDAQLQAYLGKSVVVILIRADESGSREHTGELLRYDSETVTIAAEGGETAYERSAVAAIKADDDRDI